MPKTKKARGEGLEALSVAELKARLKAGGASQTGEKGTLMWRLKLLESSKEVKLEDGRSPWALKAGELKKAAAKVGCSPMGTPDELLEGVIRAAQSQTGSTVTAAAGATGAKKKAPATAEAVAERVLALFEEGDYEGVLSLGSASPVTASTESSELQKAYRRLSLLVHPDKLRGFAQAAKAFQCVVTSLERVTAPPEAVSTAGGPDAGKGKKRIGRSNEGCVRTRVKCPRCRETWGESKLEGLPDYCYNVLMMGLKGFTCSTCLCEFGCASAVHRTACCGAEFAYSPERYHLKTRCPKCDREFGFYMYNMSDKAMSDTLQDARRQVEATQKLRDTIKRRGKRAALRGSSGTNGANDDDTTAFGEAKFLLGLVDECPRCGLFMGQGTDRDDRRTHLDSCDDLAAHDAHRRAVDALKKKDEDKRGKADAQADAQAKSLWQAGGATVETMWLLTDGNLAEIAGVEDASELDRDDLVAAAASKHSQLLLTDGQSQNAAKQTARFDPASLPANYASLPAEALRAVCAAHGLRFPRNCAKVDMLKLIDAQLDNPDTAPLLSLQADPATGQHHQPPTNRADDDANRASSKKNKKKKNKRPRPNRDDDDDDDDDDDEDYVEDSD